MYLPQVLALVFRIQWTTAFWTSNYVRLPDSAPVVWRETTTLVIDPFPGTAVSSNVRFKRNPTATRDIQPVDSIPAIVAITNMPIATTGIAVEVATFDIA